MMTKRQESKVNEIVNDFLKADLQQGFDVKLLKLYHDADTNDIVIRVDYRRTLANVIDGDIACSKVDLKGKCTPLAHIFDSIIDELKYIDKLVLIKNIR